MISSKNINDILVNLNPKILRFTGEKFPSELWNSIPIKNGKNNVKIVWLYWMPTGSHWPTHGPEVASEPGPRSYQDGEARALAALLRQSPASLSATWLNSR
mgnify:CR=1 FL=1